MWLTYTLKIQYYAHESLNKDNIIKHGVKLVHIRADALVGIASNINAGLMHYKYNSYSHYILVHHAQCKILQLQASRVTIATIGNHAGAVKNLEWNEEQNHKDIGENVFNPW